MTTIDGEYKRIPRKRKRKKSAQTLGSGGPDGWDTGGIEGVDDWDASQSAAQNTRENIFRDTSPGSFIFDILNPNEYNAESPDAPTQDQIYAAQNRSALLDSISATVNSIGSYGKLILIGIVVYFIAVR